MADSKLSNLTELAATPAVTDELYINDGGVEKKILPPNLLNPANLTELAATPASTDEFLINDAGTAKRISHVNALNPANLTELAAAPAGTDELLINDAGTAKRISANNFAAGKETIWIPAGAMRPTVSNGCDPLADVELTAGQPNLQVLDFDWLADEHAQFQIAFPKRWNLGTVTFQAFWTVNASVTTGVAIALQGVAIPNDSTIDAAYGTPVVVTDDATTTANELYVTAESAAVTIAGIPADDEVCYFRIFRDISDANDDMTSDMRLIGIKLFYTTDARDDT